MILRSSLVSASVLAMASATAASAEVPNVVTDMAPIQSLVVQVMGDLGTPASLMPQGSSPHGYSLRPSEARALQAADIVFWTGPRVEPWLEEMIGSVAQDTRSVPLAMVEGTTILDVRDGATFERHDHADDDHDDHAEEMHDDHDHDDHAEEMHDDHDHDDHAEEMHAEDMHDDHEDHDDHGHDDLDTSDGHAWLDPMNARLWLGVIAEELAALDPENAATYAANAEAAQTALDGKIAEIESQLAPLSGLNFIVFHDAYQYFENRFGLAASGAISLSDATAPSPARIREVQELIADQNVTCVFSEPQFNAGLVETVLDGTAAKTVVIDPLGVSLATGAGFYGDLMDELAGAFLACEAN